jgi:DNA-binding CsgD family transcriptional regulator
MENSMRYLSELNNICKKIENLTGSELLLLLDEICLLVRSEVEIDRCFITWIDWKERFVQTLAESVVPGAFSPAGRYSLNIYQILFQLVSHRGGTQLLVNDAEVFKSAGLLRVKGGRRYAPLPDRACAYTPIQIEQEFCAVLGCNHSNSKQWTKLETDFFNTVVRTLAKSLRKAVVYETVDIGRQRFLQVNSSQSLDKLVNWGELLEAKKHISSVAVSTINLNLTPAQINVLTYLIQGFLNKEIAKKMEISSRGVEDHVTKLLSKTGKGNRTELAIWWSKTIQEFL